MSYPNLEKIKEIKDIESLPDSKLKILVDELGDLTDKQITGRDLYIYKKIMDEKVKNKNEYARLAAEYDSIPLFDYFIETYGFDFGRPFTLIGYDVEALRQEWMSSTYDDFVEAIQFGDIKTLDKYKKQLTPPLFNSYFREAFRRKSFIKSRDPDKVLISLFDAGYIPKDFVFHDEVNLEKGFVPKVSTVDHFVKNGYDLNAKNYFGNTMLIIYSAGLESSEDSEEENEEIGNKALNLIRYILEKKTEQKIDVNAKSEFGYTALHCSVDKLYPNRVEIVNLLLKAGADPLLINVEGDTMMDILQRNINEKKERLQEFDIIDEEEKEQEQLQLESEMEVGNKISNILKNYFKSQETLSSKALLEGDRLLIDPLVKMTMDYLLPKNK